MSRVYSFPPIARADAMVLILGSMPGVASLRAGEYYAHPHNAFWPIMGRLCDFDPVAPYPERTAALVARRIAVWDVLRSCRRPGSLDARIDPATLEPNDFATFFTAHPHIRRIYFNGGMAAQCFGRLVGDLAEAQLLSLVRLPSTSPAHAGRSFAQKLAAWRVILDPRQVARTARSTAERR